MFLTKKKIQPITLFAETNIGKLRETNEDSVASLVIDTHSFKRDLNYSILVVADGMGGHEGGEIASNIATRIFLEEITSSIFHISEKSKNLNYPEILVNAVEVANSEIWSIAKKTGKDLGTTIVGAIISDHRIYIANVGDSRAYLIKPHTSIVQITKDHTAVQEMVDAKLITEEHARRHPRRNVITRALGLTSDVQVDIFETDLDNKVLMLCSDGLHGMLEEKEIAQVTSENILTSGEELISLANEHGGVDNISVALAVYPK